MTEIAPDWKQRLIAQCASTIQRLPDQPPEPEATPQTPAPSIYSIYAELLALRNEFRKGNRKSAETFSRFGEVLEVVHTETGKLREWLSQSMENQSTDNPKSRRNHAMALIDLRDRLQRLQKSAEDNTDSGWLQRLGSQSRWKQQTGAIRIVHDHLRILMQSEGIEPIQIAIDASFDPLLMKAVGEVERKEDASGSLKVAEVIQTGYCLGGECLRPTEVRLKET